MNNDNYVVCIGRQFGSGGREIGRMIAQELGIAYYDKELLVEAAKSSGMSQNYLESRDERQPNFLTHLWSAASMGFNSGAYYMDNTPVTAQNNSYQTQARAIKEIAQRGPCVIVGRTANYILRDQCRVISVFVHSDIEDRIENIIARGDCATEKEAREMAEKTNKLREGYYNFYTNQRWGEAATYDLTVNSSLLGKQATAQLIASFVRQALEP